jgi:non-ribosomal peptide synthetase component F
MAEHILSLATGLPTAIELPLTLGEADAEFARVELLHELFEHQADLRPARLAVICGGDSLTYGQLEQAANRLARRLQSLGVGPGSLVGLLLPRGLGVYAFSCHA